MPNCKFTGLQNSSSPDNNSFIFFLYKAYFCTHHHVYKGLSKEYLENAGTYLHARCRPIGSMKHGEVMLLHTRFVPHCT